MRQCCHTHGFLVQRTHIAVIKVGRNDPRISLLSWFYTSVGMDEINVKIISQKLKVDPPQSELEPEIN